MRGRYSMKISEKTRKEANQIISRYNGWKFPKEIVNMYSELEVLGIEIPCWSAWDGNSHPYNLNGEEVENSLFVFYVYKSEQHEKNEYTMYLS